MDTRHNIIMYAQSDLRSFFTTDNTDHVISATMSYRFDTTTIWVITVYIRLKYYNLILHIYDNNKNKIVYVWSCKILQIVLSVQ